MLWKTGRNWQPRLICKSIYSDLYFCVLQVAKAKALSRFGKDLAQSKSWRGQMKSAQRHLDDAMNPIWSPDWLRSSEQKSGSPNIPPNLSPLNDNPYYYTYTLAKSLENIYLRHGYIDERLGENLAIRDQFLPELLIAYISTLSFYGHAVAREYLVECMDLVAYVADEAKGKHIVETLMRTGRMAEFVEAVTRVSRQMVAANETVQKGVVGRRKKLQRMVLWGVKTPAA